MNGAHDYRLPQSLFHLCIVFARCGCKEAWHFGSPRIPGGMLHVSSACRALRRPRRESKSPHLWICALLVMSKSQENTGLNSQPTHYGKNPIPPARALQTAEEILPGDGKIFTMAALVRHPCPGRFPWKTIRFERYTLSDRLQFWWIGKWKKSRAAYFSA